MTAVEKNTVMEIATPADLTPATVAGRMKSMVTERPLVTIGTLVTIGIVAGVGILLSFLWHRQAHGQFRGLPSEGASYRP